MTQNLARVEVEAFRSALTRTVGLRFDDDKLPFLAELLLLRVKETHCKTAASYVEKVAHRSSELAELAPALTVSETYFLRNANQFRALAALLSSRQKAYTRQLRLLSAGCSTGEEAYSLAITVRETLGNPADRALLVLGVDLNAEAIESARSGTYSRWSLRETPDAIRGRYFVQNGNRYAVGEEIRTRVQFEQQNLLQPAKDLWRNEAYDIVFCRNVLMYLAPAAASSLIRNIARSLAPGGHLFLGHAENLRGLSNDFHLRHSHDTFYYERRAALNSVADRAPPSRAEGPLETTEVPSEDASWFGMIAKASGQIEKLSREGLEVPEARETRREIPSVSIPAAEQNHVSSAMDLLKQERFQEALRLLASAPQPASTEPDALLLRAMLLVSTGQLSSAATQCEELLEEDELNASAHYILAICREHAGDYTGAVEHSRAAVYLDSEFAMPHLQLGRFARRARDLPTARRELGLALGLLHREDTARIALFGGGFSRASLLELCRAELRACGGTE